MYENNIVRFSFFPTYFHSKTKYKGEPKIRMAKTKLEYKLGNRTSIVLQSITAFLTSVCPTVNRSTF